VPLFYDVAVAITSFSSHFRNLGIARRRGASSAAGSDNVVVLVVSPGCSSTLRVALTICFTERPAAERAVQHGRARFMRLIASAMVRN
jgi:hypothetical protein